MKIRSQNTLVHSLAKLPPSLQRLTGVLLPALLYSISIAALLTSTGEAQTRYKIINIPTPTDFDSTALGLNNSGDVVGYDYQGSLSKAFLYSYSTGAVTDLGTLEGQSSVATGINGSGQIVGYSQNADGNTLAFLYSPDQGMASLGTLSGGSNSEAFGINSAGQSVGDSQFNSDVHRPVLFADGAVKDLGASTQSSDTLKTAYGINDSGQIVGRYDAPNGATHGFLFSGQLTDLGTLGGSNSEALAINKFGLMVGDSETSNGTTHAFAVNGAQIQDLGTLPEFNKASYARGVNDSGQIVGESDSDNQKRAFVYTNGLMVDLTHAAINLRQAGFSALDVADGINNRGWIVGFGTTRDGHLHAFLAIPVGPSADPPGGYDAGTFDSGSIAIIGWSEGCCCPPNLWPPPWHHHHPWPPPPPPHPTPTPRPTPPPGNKPTPTPTPRPTPTPGTKPTPTPTPPILTKLPTPTPTPVRRGTPTPTPIQSITKVTPRLTATPKSTPILKHVVHSTTTQTVQRGHIYPSNSIYNYKGTGKSDDTSRRRGSPYRTPTTTAAPIKHYDSKGTGKGTPTRKETPYRTPSNGIQ
jgi:probable HAF family extracellular repeat protein